MTGLEKPPSSVTTSPDGRRFRAKREIALIARGLVTHKDIARTRPSLRSSPRAWEGHVYVTTSDPTSGAVLWFSSVVDVRDSPQLLFEGFLQNGGQDANGKTVEGLVSTASITVAADGRTLYVAGGNNPGTLAWFPVQADGSLVFGGLLRGEQPDGNGNIVKGLRNAISVTKNPSSSTIYVASGYENTVSWFSVQKGCVGCLVFGGYLKDATQDRNGTMIDGLGKAQSVTCSPDGSTGSLRGRGREREREREREIV